MTSDMSGDYNTQNYLSDMTESGSPIIQNQQIEGDNTILTAQSDLVLPLGAKRKLETGIRGSMRDYSSVNQNFIFDNSSQEYVLIPNLTANYKYVDQVYAAYVTYSHQIKNSVTKQAYAQKALSMKENSLRQEKNLRPIIR